MKKTNKKGFTLAELLIVIAIIAVLIAIAIPTFSGALRNARLQTDHANIRSAYAMVMTANMMGKIDVNGTPTDGNASTPYYFLQDGTLGTSNTGAYELQVTAENDATATPPKAECASSVGCKGGSKYVADAGSSTHTKGNYIIIIYTGTEFQLKLNTSPS